MSTFGAKPTSSHTAAIHPEAGPPSLEDAIDAPVLQRSDLRKRSHDQMHNNGSTIQLAQENEECRLDASPSTSASASSCPSSITTESGIDTPMMMVVGAEEHVNSTDAANQAPFLHGGSVADHSSRIRDAGKASDKLNDNRENKKCRQQGHRPRSSSLEISAVVLPDEGRSPFEEHGRSTGVHGEDSTTKLWLEIQRKKAAACEEEGDLMFSRALLRETLPVATHAVQQGLHDNSYLGQLLAELANVCYQLGDADEAIDYYINSIAQDRKALTRQHQQPLSKLEQSHCLRLFRSMEAVCQIYVESRLFNYALCVYKEIYDIQVEVFGPHSLEVASTLCNMGLMHYLLQLYTPSLHFYQEALRISLFLLQNLEKAESSNMAMDSQRPLRSISSLVLEKSVADSLNAMGLLCFKLRRFEEATRAFAGSMMNRERLLGPYHKDVTILWYNLAMVRVETSDSRAAIPLYEEGLRRDRIRLGDDYHPQLSSVLQHLGEIYNQLGEFDDSLACFQQALQIECRATISLTLATNAPTSGASRCNDHLTSVCRLLNVIGNIHLMQANIPACMQCFVQSARTAAKLVARGSQYIPLVVAGHMFCHMTRWHPDCAAAA